VASHDSDLAQLQRRIPESAGVAFDERGFIGLRVLGWLPR
jgi:hypothetical protein